MEETIVIPPIADKGHHDRSFCTVVVEKAGDNFRRCLQCLTCAGGCPVAEAMRYRPNGVIRLVQLGLKREVLESPDIWLCIGCNNCSIACPQAIDIAAIMDALREIALESGVNIAEQAILDFHREVLNSIERYGRTHKLDIMMRYKLRRRDFFSDMDVGLKMLAKRKLDLLPSKIEHPERIRDLFAEFNAGSRP